MVIPIGGGSGLGGPALMGPPPAELQHRFRKIKLSLIVLISSLIAKFIAGLLFNPHNIFFIIWSCLNPILNSVIGVFLLKDDPMFARVYECFITTCCGSCAQQGMCQGGMSCLCTWFFCNMITCIFALLPFQNSDMTILISGFQILGQPSRYPSNIWAFEFSIFLAATLFALLAQIFGAYEGFMAYKQASEQSALQGGGDWAGAGGGGDPYGGYPTAPSRSAARQADDEESRGGGRAVGGSSRGANFQPFQGSGNRLGS